jgi:hypothetical protein
MNKSKIVNKCLGLIRLPLLLKHDVGGRFLFFRRWFCRYVIVEKEAFMSFIFFFLVMFLIIYTTYLLYSVIPIYEVIIPGLVCMTLWGILWYLLSSD